MLNLRTGVAPLYVTRVCNSHRLLVAMIRHERVLRRDTTQLMCRPVNRQSPCFLQLCKPPEVFKCDLKGFSICTTVPRVKISARLRLATARLHFV